MKTALNIYLSKTIQNKEFNMELLTVEEVIKFHKDLLRESRLKEDEDLGGCLSNKGNLEFIVEESNYINDPFEKAAWILFGIATGHPFVQGNKRMAFILAVLIIVRTPERYTLDTSDEENDSFVREVAEGRKTREDVIAWLRSKAKRG
jgi:death-on-curing protein